MERMKKSIRQLKRQFVSQDSCFENEKIHIVVLYAMLCCVELLARCRADPGMLISRNGSADGTGANQHATIDAAAPDSGGELTGHVVVAVQNGITSVQIFERVTLITEFEFQNLREFDSTLV
jgi:hypothetical protein